MAYRIKRKVSKSYIPLSDKLEKQMDEKALGKMFEVKFGGPELSYKVNVCAKSTTQAKSKVYKSLHPSAKRMVFNFKAKKIRNKC